MEEAIGSWASLTTNRESGCVFLVSLVIYCPIREECTFMALTIPTTRRVLDVSEKKQLAEALGDSPETALSVHLLRLGHGQVYMAGDLPNFDAVIIEDYDVGPEL